MERKLSLSTSITDARVQVRLLPPPVAWRSIPHGGVAELADAPAMNSGAGAEHETIAPASRRASVAGSSSRCHPTAACEFKPHPLLLNRSSNRRGSSRVEQADISRAPGLNGRCQQRRCPGERPTDNCVSSPHNTPAGRRRLSGVSASNPSPRGVSASRATGTPRGAGIMISTEPGPANQDGGHGCGTEIPGPALPQRTGP